MTGAALTAAVFLLANFAVGMLRLLRGPTEADILLVAQLVGSTGTGVLLLLGAALGAPALYDVALLFVLLATVAAAAFVRMLPKAAEGDEP